VFKEIIMIDIKTDPTIVSRENPSGVIEIQDKAGHLEEAGIPQLAPRSAKKITKEEFIDQIRGMEGSAGESTADAFATKAPNFSTDEELTKSAEK